MKNSRLLVRCHAGCSQDAVIGALRERSLWPEATSRELGRRPATYKSELISGWYDYHDEQGLRYVVARTPSKQFPVFHLDAEGEWRGGYGRERILYRLPEILAADPAEPVLIVEGEKDCERARTEGFIATTTPGGAGKAHLCDLSPLRGRHVVIIPDNDGPGRTHAADLVRLLTGIAASVRVVTLSEALS